jgi:hypothetical protein
MGHDTRAGRRAGAVGRGFDDTARDVLSGTRAITRALEQERLAAVERVRLDGDDGLVVAASATSGRCS